MKKKIFILALGILLISMNAFADGNCNLAGSSNAGGMKRFLHDSSLKKVASEVRRLLESKE